MASPAKPPITRGTASAEEQLKAMREFLDLSDEMSFAKKLIWSLYEHVEEDESNEMMNQSDAQKLQQLERICLNYSGHKVCIQMIGDELAEANAVPILMKYMNILTDDGSDYPLDGYNFRCYQLIREVLTSCTDTTPNLCRQVGREGMLDMLLYDLKYFQETFENSEAESYIVTSAMAIFSNCSSVSENIRYFREINAVPTVAWYVENSEDVFKGVIPILSILTLSYIVDEENYDIVLTDASIIQTFLKLLDGALKSSDGRCVGFSQAEIARGLTRLANNDKTSAIIVQNGILHLLLKMMNGDEEDRLVATEAVWALAFVDVNKKKIESFQNGNIMEYLRHFSKSQSSDLKNAAAGALWVLELARKAQAKQQQQQSQSSKGKCEGHVMISYQWDSQDTMKEVRDLLKSKGFKVWMDIDNMEGNILGGMADAVEKASVVLVCLSQKYKDSHNCRTEGEYAYSNKKPMIPVLVEEKYKADGWLGALVGMKLYYDLSDRQKFQDNISKLVKELSSKK